MRTEGTSPPRRRQPVDHFGRWRCWLSILLLTATCLAGCRPTFQASKEARPWPALDRDPAENGVDLERWPGWRGNNGSGIVAGGNPAVEFGKSEGIRWKVSVPGAGNSSPVVWDDFVLLTSALDDTDPPTLAVLCFDRRDGTPVWQAAAGEVCEPTHNKNGYASASVATDGARIFAFFGSTGLFCYDFSGGQLWRADLGDLSHRWGTAASPVLFGDTVIQLCDCAKDSYIAAFEKTSGKRVWRTPRSSAGCWSTPVFVDVEVDGRQRTEMVVNGGEGSRLIIAYDPIDGRELWWVGRTSDFVTPTPVTCNGLVYCTSGRNGPIMAIRPGGSGDVTRSHLIWQSTRGGPYIPSGVAYRNRLYLVGDGGRITSYNAGNGATIWSGRLKSPITSSLIAADGRLYAVNERGTVFVLAAGDTFARLATNDLQSRCLTTPAVADGELLLRTETELYCFAANRDAAAAVPRKAAPATADAASQAAATIAASPESAWPLFRGNPQATGVAGGTLPEKLDPLWTFSVQRGGFPSTAAVEDGTVYIGCGDGKLYAIDLATGQERWQFATELGFTASPAVRDGSVFIGDSDGRFYAIDAGTGKRRWDFSTDAEINSSANFHRDNVLFGSQDGFLYCLKRVSGELVWKYQSEDMIQCSPTVADDRALVAGCDARLSVIDLIHGKRVAKVDIEAPTLCTAAVAGDMAYVGTTGDTFFAVDWRKAEVVWRYRGAQRQRPFHGSAAVTPQAIIVGSQDKRVHAIDRHSGRPLWTFTTKGRVDSSPVVVGERVFVGSADGRLYALDVASGELLWQFEAGGSILASPAVVAGRLVIGTDEGDVYCFGTSAPL